MPFRSAADAIADIEPPPRIAPPQLLSFAVAGDHCRAVYRAHGTIRVVSIDRRSGRATLVATFAETDATPRAVSIREHWGVVQSVRDGGARFCADGTEVDVPLGAGDLVVPLVVDSQPCLAISRESQGSTHRHGPRIDVLDGRLATVLPEEWFAPPTARSLLAATSTVFGPATVYSTDRPDEIDVCASGREGAALQRTVSLGRAQSFECAQGGGSRIMVVSRDASGIVARTLASDVRSELNPVPIRPRTGWSVDRVRCVYANGPFVVAHSETRDDATVGVLTVFDAGQSQTHRLSLPGIDALAVDGKDICAAVMVPSASAPVLLLNRTTREGRGARHYAFFLEEPDTRTTYARHAVLLDVADIVARALGSRATAEFRLRSLDDLGDAAEFRVPGIDRANDISIAVLLREDGSGITSLRVGGGAAPEPRALHFAERLREVFTGDDDGDVTTTRVEHTQVANGIESIVSAVGALRAVRGV